MKVILIILGLNLEKWIFPSLVEMRAIAFKYIGDQIQNLLQSDIDDVLIDVPGGGGGGGGGTVDPVDEINEDFHGTTNNADIDFTGWTSITVEGDRKWHGTTFMMK